MNDYIKIPKKLLFNYIYETEKDLKAARDILLQPLSRTDYEIQNGKVEYLKGYLDAVWTPCINVWPTMEDEYNRYAIEREQEEKEEKKGVVV